MSTEKTENLSPTSEKDRAPAPQSRRKRSRRGRIMAGLLIVFLLAGLGWGAWWYAMLRFTESTDDAYVSGNVLRIMPQVDGKVVSVEADDNDRVLPGQTLALIDPVDARLALEHALVELASAVRDTCRLRSELRENEATVRMRRVDLRRESDNLARREILAQRNAIGTEELRHARDSRASAVSALTEAEEKRNALAAVLLDTPLAEQPAVRQAAAKVRDRWLDLQRTTVRSPAAGQVAKRSVQAGEVVSPGTPLMTVIPLDHLWIDANFKEVQLRRMRIGQPAAIHVDMYGADVVYHGRVGGFSAGTGSAFSLLPPQNATGNWIKIVQRVPVRIDIDPADLREHPLLVGLSALVEVDTSDVSGPLLARSPRTAPLPDAFTSQAPAVDFAPAEESIAAIIHDNAVPGVRPASEDRP